MACEFDKGLLAAHYDGETTDAERAEVERHLASCPECARDLASMKSLSAALKPLARGSAPMSIAEGVMREVGASRRARRPWVGWIATAAAALLMAVGTYYILDRQSPAPKGENLLAADRKTDTKALSDRALERREDPKSHLESKAKLERVPAEESRVQAPSRTAPADKAAPPPAPASEPPVTPDTADRAEPAKPEPRDEKAKKDAEEFQMEKRVVPAIPVVRITAADLSLARAEVAAFLKERELKKAVTGSPLLGRTSFVKERYLQVELTDEETKELEKRLAALKRTEVAVGSFEDEKKRVALDAFNKRALEFEEKSDDDAAKEAEKGALGADRFRAGVKLKEPERRKVILVFETPPAKK